MPARIEVQVSVPELEVAGACGLDASECGGGHVELLAGRARAAEEHRRGCCGHSGASLSARVRKPYLPEMTCLHHLLDKRRLRRR
jgi:hypothetical protein